MTQRVGSLLCCGAGLLLALAGCSSSREVVGEQCPSPASGHATVLGNQPGTNVFGTSCAPCKAPKLDKNGCPIFVTFASCGGNICLGNTELTPQLPEEDAGGERDSGAEEDSGAH